MGFRITSISTSETRSERLDREEKERQARAAAAEREAAAQRAKRVQLTFTPYLAKHKSQDRTVVFVAKDTAMVLQNNASGSRFKVGQCYDFREHNYEKVTGEFCGTFS